MPRSAASEKSAIDRIGDRVVFLVERMLALGLIAAIVLDFVNVVGRYTGGFTLLGADEIEIYALIWIAFLGAVTVTWRRQHLRMDVLYNSSPRFVRKVIAVSELAVMFIVTGFVATQSLFYVAKLYALGVRSDILRIPTWVPHLAVALCFGAMAAIVALRGLRLIVSPNDDLGRGAP
jgi:TRAP-type C4-dicarboxylate transport system permease small subunit